MAPAAQELPPVTDSAIDVGLRGKVARGVSWKLLSQTVAQTASAACGVVLAHLLTPHQFGLAGMALVFAGLAGIFTDLAFGAALVQRSTITEADRSTAFWTSLAAGLVLTAAAIALSPLVGALFSTPAVTPLFAAIALIFLLSSLSATQSALLTRAMNFRSLEIRAMVSVLAGVCVALPLAFLGAGAWTIVVQYLVTSSVAALLVWRLSDWRPRLMYSFESLRGLGSFGTKTFLSQFLSYLNLNMDNLLVGRYLGSTALGEYAVAYNIMFLPVSRISRPISDVAFSAFAKVQHEPARLREAWLRGGQLVSALNVPAFLGMAVVAPEFVPVVLGHKWHAAVPVLQLLSVAGVADTLQTLNWSAVQATGRAGVMLRLRLITTPLTLSAFVAGLTWGIVGVAGLFAAARIIVLIMTSAVTCRALNCPIASAVRAAVPVVSLSVVMALGVYALRTLLVQEGVAPAVRLVTLVVFGVAVYALLLLWRAPELLAELRSFVPTRR
jgi:O-antigen/teichoic acid export membrane protein